MSFISASAANKRNFNLLVGDTGSGGGPPTGTWTVLDSTGASFSPGFAVLDSTGASFTVPQAVLDSTGASFTPI